MWFNDGQILKSHVRKLKVLILRDSTLKYGGNRNKMLHENKPDPRLAGEAADSSRSVPNCFSNREKPVKSAGI